MNLNTLSQKDRNKLEMVFSDWSCTLQDIQSKFIDTESYEVFNSYQELQDTISEREYSRFYCLPYIHIELNNKQYLFYDLYN